MNKCRMAAAEEDRLLEVLVEFAQAYREKDLQRLVQMFASDAEVISPEGFLYKGADEGIRNRFLLEFAEVGDCFIQPLSVDITTRSERASIATTYKLTVTARGAAMEHCSTVV